MLQDVNENTINYFNIPAIIFHLYNASQLAFWREESGQCQGKPTTIRLYEHFESLGHELIT